MVACVHGFPSKIIALQFEWSWQHPKKSKRVREAIEKVKNVGHEYKLKAKLAYLFEIVNQPPWRTFPLTVQILSDKCLQVLKEFPSLPPGVKLLVAPVCDIELYHIKELVEKSKESPKSETSTKIFLLNLEF